MKIYKSWFGKKLKAIRKPKMGQSELAAVVGVEPASVSRWETGDSFPDDDKLLKICSALGVTENYFLQFDPAPATASQTALAHAIVLQQEEIERLNARAVALDEQLIITQRREIESQQTKTAGSQNLIEAELSFIPKDLRSAFAAASEEQRRRMAKAALDVLSAAAHSANLATEEQRARQNQIRIQESLKGQAPRRRSKL
jgi:transcriptional regulator with XRE-family HTH domain